MKRNRKIRTWLCPVIFTLSGALAGLGYYFIADCTTGSCPITASPVRTMVYTAVIGLLLSVIFGKDRDNGCNT